MSQPPARLLVVDDDENNRDMLSRRLIRRGFDVGVAADGYRALETLGREAYDLVLLDVQMPGLSGFEVLQQIRLDRPPTRLPVIIATARSDSQDVVEALNLGANDYVTKPLDFPVVLARIDAQLAHKRAVDRIVSLEEDLRRRNEELESQNLRIHRSLELAAGMQRALLPTGPLDVSGVAFAWAYHPCDELGGDILNIFPIGPRTVGLYLLDVSGHGVPAALLSVTLSRVLHARPGQSSLVARTTDAGGLEPRTPADVATELNRRFPMDDHLEQYFTIFYGVLDLDRGILRYVSAGQPPALYLPAAGDPNFLEGTGHAIGWFPEPEFEERELAMRPGDRLLVYSDGIIESANESKEPFGRARLLRTCADGRHDPIEGMLDQIVYQANAHRGPIPAADDVSALAVELKPS